MAQGKGLLMAHSHHEHRAHHVSRKRVHHVMKSGGHAHHADEAADKKLFHHMIKAHAKQEHGVHGLKRGGRLDKYARGGAAKDKKHHTQVNIAVVAPHGKDQAGAASGGLPMPPPRPPAGLPPGGPPPMGMPPGGPPPGMMPKPPMKRGGTVRPAKMVTKSPKGGAYSGEGRLEKSHEADATKRPQFPKKSPKVT